jgi:hypothetical protein
MFKRLVNLLLSLVAIGVILYSLKPVAEWYLNLKQIPGSDYWNTGTYLQKLVQDPVWPGGKWYYQWFTGVPAAIDYPWLHLYLMQPLVNIYGVIQAQSYYALGSLAVLTTGLAMYGHPAIGLVVRRRWPLIPADIYQLRFVARCHKWRVWD